MLEIEIVLKKIKTIRHKITSDEYNNILDELENLKMNIIQPDLEFDIDPDQYSVFFYITDLSIELIREIDKKYKDALKKNIMISEKKHILIL